MTIFLFIFVFKEKERFPGTLYQEGCLVSQRILIEYTIPCLAKGIDFILLLHNIVFCLEFKVGETQYLQNAEEQVKDYALDLKSYLESIDLQVIPPSKNL